MAQNFAVMSYGPRAGTAVSVSAASTSAQDLGAGTTRVVISSTTLCHIIFGDSSVAAAQSTDYPLQPNTDYVFDIAPFCRYFRVIRDSASGTLTWAVVQ
mgnify:CR=1 FL=1